MPKVVHKENVNGQRCIKAGDGKTLVKLPYKNRVDKFSDSGEHIGTDSFDDLDVSMYLMLADSGINVERELDTAITDENFKRTYTKLSMPKFKIEYSERLNDTLKKHRH